MIIPSSSSSLSSSSLADQQMTTTSHHHFGNPSKNLETFSITIIESMKEEYGLFVWPCSVVLAEYVWQQMSCFSGVSMIKLGAGTSLPGLVAAKVGLDVTLTAESNRPELKFCVKQHVVTLSTFLPLPAGRTVKLMKGLYACGSVHPA
ncbi:hypothetical protein TEA_006532 [Camellia sinensis var. sinensis]|uniref:Methyltransferase n=1 Tax=Camellia sinensis var. sinensis TaxID=542762 RepID=A0A4V3WMF0_CAMSN|nr:hypothetical protein TEA_006532 [Camellia sinensis var. sinensis]